MKKLIFCILKLTEDYGTDPHPDLLVTDPEHCYKRRSHDDIGDICVFTYL
jgi:hypothetical protein